MLERNEVDIIVTNSPNQALNDMMDIIPVKEFHDVFIAKKMTFLYMIIPYHFRSFKNILY